MGTVNNTRLTTSEPRNLTTGFPIFPTGTSLNRPILPVTIGVGTAPALNQTIFRTEIPLAWFRFSGSTNTQVIIGAFFGFNLAYNVAGVTRNDGTASLTVSNDAAQGGLGFGAGLTIAINLRVEEGILEFTFRDGFTTRWRALLSQSSSFTIDMIDTILLVLRVAGGINVPLTQLREFRGVAGSGAIWGLFSSASSEFASRGRLQLRPRLNISGDILKNIPVLRPLMTALKAIGAKAKAGPVFNIIFPITINIVRLTTEDGDYDFTNQTNGQFNFRGGRVGTLTPTVRDVRMVHSHTVGFEWGLELKASFSLWTLFSVSGTVVVPLNLGVPITRPNITVGPFFTTLPPVQTAALELPEVVWG